MKLAFLLLLVLTTLSPATGNAKGTGKAIQSAVNVQWQFDIQEDSYNNPQGKVYLIVDGRKVLVRQNVTAQYSVLERADYKSRDVPAGAIAACTGWWAGQGEDLYVVRRNKQLIVYIRYLDEGTDLSSYQRLKVIRLK